MSPGATMERVYLDLKARVLAGAYPPGSRLDPAQLAKSLDASATPVRDALYRLSGERLIESWHQEGFRQPMLAESDLHALYEWGGALLALALRGRRPVRDSSGLVELATRAGYPEGIANLFRTIAFVSENRELRLASVNMIERSQILRAAEVRVDRGSGDALAAMEEDFRFGRWTALRGKITRFHGQRMALAGRIAAELKPRTDPLR